MTGRWPPLVLIVALLAGGLVVGRSTADAEGAPASPEPASLLPASPPADALGSIWFCAGQTVGADTMADGTIVVANPGDQPASGRLSVITDADQRATRALAVAPRTTERVRVATMVDAGWAAVTVELDRGGVLVEHEVAGPDGRDVAPCHTQGGDRWYVPSGATTRDARLRLAVYNPYPDAATVDMGFTTVEGLRRPRAFRGVPVAARSLVVIDVSPVVTVREVISTTVTTRTGRVVVDRIQSYDGSGASTTAEEAEEERYLRQGLTVTPAVPVARPVWGFAAGVKAPGVHERITVFNPGRTEADVAITVALDDPRRNGELDPFPLAVPAAEFATFDLDAVDVVPEAVTHSLEVRSRGGSPIVVERTLAAGEGANHRDVLSSTGSPLAAPRWGFAAGWRGEGVEVQRMALFNPGSEPASVTLTAFGDGQRSPIEADDAPGPIDLAPGEHREVVVAGGPSARRSVEVTATVPIIAERRLIDGPREDSDGDEQPGRGGSTALGIPLGTGLVLLDG